MVTVRERGMEGVCGTGKSLRSSAYWCCCLALLSELAVRFTARALRCLGSWCSLQAGSARGSGATSRRPLEVVRAVEPVAARTGDSRLRRLLSAGEVQRLAAQIPRLRIPPMKFTVAALAFASVAVAAQSLPPPSRTIYRCDDGKKVHYSDTPCLGAKKVDVEPTRGLNRSTGRERMGHDVRREMDNEMIADALRPILNETPEQRATRHRRFKLEPAAKSECARLDVELRKLEERERSATKEALEAAQESLLESRTRYLDLRC